MNCLELHAKNFKLEYLESFFAYFERLAVHTPFDGGYTFNNQVSQSGHQIYEHTQNYLAMWDDLQQNWYFTDPAGVLFDMFDIENPSVRNNPYPPTGHDWLAFVDGTFTDYKNVPIHCMGKQFLCFKGF